MPSKLSDEDSFTRGLSKQTWTQRRAKRPLAFVVVCPSILSTGLIMEPFFF